MTAEQIIEAQFKRSMMKEDLTKYIKRETRIINGEETDVYVFKLDIETVTCANCVEKKASK